MPRGSHDEGSGRSNRRGSTGNYRATTHNPMFEWGQAPDAPGRGNWDPQWDGHARSSHNTPRHHNGDRDFDDRGYDEDPRDYEHGGSHREVGRYEEDYSYESKGSRHEDTRRAEPRLDRPRSRSGRDGGHEGRGSRGGEGRYEEDDRSPPRRGTGGRKGGGSSRSLKKSRSDASASAQRDVLNDVFEGLKPLMTTTRPPMTAERAALKLQAAWRSKQVRLDLEERKALKKLKSGANADGFVILDDDDEEEDEEGEGENAAASFRKAAFHCFRDRWVLVGVVAAAAVQTACVIAFLLTLSLFIDDLTVTSTDGQSAVVANSTLVTLAILAFLLSALTFCKTLLRDVGGDRLSVTLRKVLAETIRMKPMRWYESQVTADLVDGVGPDVDYLVDGVFKNTISAFWNVAMIVCGYIVMGILSKASMGIAFAILPVLGLSTYLEMRYTKKFVRDHRNAVTSCNVEISEFIDKIGTIRGCGMEGKEMDDYLTSVERASVLYRKMTRSDAVATFATQLLSALTQCVLLWFQGTQVAAAKMSVGKVIASQLLCAFVLLYIYFLTENVEEIAESLANSGMILTLADDFYSDEDEDIAYLYDSSNRAADFAADDKGMIVFESVTLPGNQRPIYDRLDDFTLEVPAGKVMALVGGSGCGLSNVPRLLKRWYRAKGGRVLIDGVNIDDFDRSFNMQVGLIGEPVILKGSVLDNIRYGQSDMAVMAVHMSAKLADAHRFIMQLPRGYHTVIGDGGVKLSPAQAARVCLARIFAQNPPIVVMDDPVGNLDESSARRVRTSLRRMMRNPIRRTVIVMSQRVEDTDYADMVSTVANGKVVESGDRAELMKDSTSKFSRFVEGQMKLRKRVLGNHDAKVKGQDGVSPSITPRAGTPLLSRNNSPSGSPRAGRRKKR